jgi:thiamine pyrophosphokinase
VNATEIEGLDDTVVVVTGVDPIAPERVDDLPAAVAIIAADGALDAARAAGLSPTVLVGDLDSISPDGLAWAEAHAEVERHDPDKDHTDTELALDAAVVLDPARLILLSGGGDRLDHTFAAIGALGRSVLTSVPRLEAWWAGQRIVVVHGPGRARIEVGPGRTLSLLALHGPCTGVGAAGVRWPLDRAELAPLAGHGVSNVAVEPVVEVVVSTGVLSVFVDPPGDADDGSTRTDATDATRTSNDTTDASTPSEAS